MNAQQIIEKFKQYVDDTTELSTQAELDLLNAIYQEIANERPWEILKKESSGTISDPLSIPIPSDFSHLLENQNYTDNSYSTQMNAKPVAVIVTTSGGNTPIQIVNWSDRKQYQNTTGYAYLDINSGVIRFTGIGQPVGSAYSFDYKGKPVALTLSDSPIFPAEFHMLFAYRMAIEDMIIQLFDKSRSNAQDNAVRALTLKRQMDLWNANLQNY